MLDTYQVDLPCGDERFMERLSRWELEIVHVRDMCTWHMDMHVAFPRPSKIDADGIQRR